MLVVALGLLMFIGPAGFADPAFESMRGPHERAACAGFLTAPEFETLGTRYRVQFTDPETLTAPDAAPLTYARVFEGADAVSKYVAAATALAFEVDRAAERAGRAPPVYWTSARKDALKWSAVLPVTWVAAVGIQATVLASTGGPPEVWAASAALSSGAGYLWRDHALRAWALLAMARRPMERDAVISTDPEWSGELMDFLAHVGVDEAWPRFLIRQLFVPVGRGLGRLLVDPPRADADSREVENYRAMVAGELARPVPAEERDHLLSLTLFFSRDAVDNEVRLIVAARFQSAGLPPTRRTRKSKAHELAAPSGAGSFLPTF